MWLSMCNAVLALWSYALCNGISRNNCKKKKKRGMGSLIFSLNLEPNKPLKKQKTNPVDFLTCWRTRNSNTVKGKTLQSLRKRWFCWQWWVEVYFRWKFVCCFDISLYWWKVAIERYLQSSCSECHVYCCAK